MSHHGWIGVDLDGTLAHYDGWKGPQHIGEPVPKMVERVKAWLANGADVRIFTARVADIGPEGIAARGAIKEWCAKHLGQVIPITNQKDIMMVELWDDRCVCVERNTGKILGHNP